MGGQLVLAATPIGCVEDASPRLRRLIEQADIVAAEDTRRFRRLAADLGLTPPARVVSYFDGNEASRAAELLEEVRGGALVLVVSDAGMPTISDPGFRVVSACVAAGLPVTAIPGPSAVLTALALSGLPVDRFCFEGFLPRRPGERGRALAALRREPRTMVFFEAPHRTAASLTAMAEAFGADRPAALCRELTKTYEQVLRAGLSDLAATAAAGVRGEIVLVVGGVHPGAVPTEEELADLVQACMAGGATRRDAVDEVAARTGSPRRVVYAAATRGRQSAT